MTFYDEDGQADHPQATPTPAPAPAARAANPASSPQPQSEQLLRRVADLIASSRPMPLSSSVMINKDEVLELLEEAIDRLPDEMRAARWLLKEREDFLAKTRRDAEDILDAARARAERMVQRTEVVKSADQRARQIVESATDEARRLRLECEDFCDQRLASFEIVLERTRKTVAAGRAKLQGQSGRNGGDPITGATPQVRPAEPEPDSGFFDQDQQ